MNPVWIMVVMFCPGYSDRAECRREIVPGRFQTEQSCKELGALMKNPRTSFVCIANWEKSA